MDMMLMKLDIGAWETKWMVTGRLICILHQNMQGF